MTNDLKTILGPGNYLDAPDDMASYLRPWRGEAVGRAALVAFPKTTAQVAEVVRYCAEHRLPMVPQAGNTGVVYGSLTDNDNAIIINTSKMRHIRDVASTDGSMVVEAGVTLAEIQQAAEEAGKFFPLSMASEGSAMLGGMVATNPGGTAVLSYGNFRDMVLGLEVVLPSGEIWSDLRPLRKNNAGFDLKHLFIGSEGTLGIATAATLKLFPKPKQKTTALLAINQLADGLTCLSQLQNRFGQMLTGFEVFSAVCMDVVKAHMPDLAFPLQTAAPYYLLVEWSSELADYPLKDKAEEALGEVWESANIQDGVVAASDSQSAEIWAWRENISEAARHFGTGIHFDIAVPVGHVASFVDRTNALIAAALPSVTTIAFGHMGDGNIHYNQYVEKSTAPETLTATRRQLEDIIYTECTQQGGTISAEHGVGTDRQEAFYQYADSALLSLMQQVKQAIDPQGLMNPGKVLR